MDQAGWHRQLLERMRLDLTPIRPAVIDSEIYDKLDEMLASAMFSVLCTDTPWILFGFRLCCARRLS